MRLVALTFNVQTLEGDLHGGDGSAAVVIDIIGRPLTPPWRASPAAAHHYPPCY
jgi:hypothetical protein